MISPPGQPGNALPVLPTAMLLVCCFVAAIVSFGGCYWFGGGKGRAAQAKTTATDEGQFHVAIDIGHTPNAPGAVGADGTVEYEFNKNIVNLLEAELNQHSKLSVIVINQEGKEISLAERSATANSANANLLLSIHHDSTNDKYLAPREVDGHTYYQTDEFHGYSVFFSGKNAQQSTSLKFARALGTAMKSQGFTPTLHHAEKIRGENRPLVIRELGVYRFDDLVVLKEAKMPAALLECGLIVNPKEEAELKQPEYQKKIVVAITKAVLQMAEPTGD